MGTKKINLLKAAYTPNIKVKRQLCGLVHGSNKQVLLQTDTERCYNRDKQTIVADIISTDAIMAFSAERAPGSRDKNDQ